MGVDVRGFLINKKFYDKVTDKFEEDFIKVLMLLVRSMVFL